MLVLGVFSLSIVSPSVASASFFGGILGMSVQADVLPEPTSLNSQTMPVAMANIGPSALSGDKTDKASTDIVISDAALTPSMGPVGNAADAAVAPDTAGSITFYTVQDGDTISSVARMFGVTSGTIISANSLKAGQALKKDSILVILPFSGISYTVKKGDTIKSIATAYHVDPSDINFYNNLTSDSVLSLGDTILIPDATYDGTSDSAVTNPTTKKPTTTTPKKAPVVSSGPVPMTADGLYTTTKNGKSTMPITVHPIKDFDKINLGNAILRPVSIDVSRRSQGAHGAGRTAVDLAAPLGTPLVAAYDGTILLAITGGWNGGYGNYIIESSIIDGNPVEFIYGHEAKVIVTAGQHVSRGEVIGYIGMTGDATGPHVHFEVRGALNPLTVNAKYTGE